MHIFFSRRFLSVAVSAALALAFPALTACGPNYQSLGNITRLADDPGSERQAPNQNQIPSSGPTDENPVPRINGQAVVGAANGFRYPSDLNSTGAQQILARYPQLDPTHIVPTVLLEKAVLFFDQNKSQVKNRDFMGVINFSQRSTQARFYIIDMKTGAVWPVHVAHGKGSDLNGDGYAERFSNTSGTNASSLGFYVTGETYDGEHGLSMRLDGLSPTNSNVRERAIVLHGADYVSENDVIQGRSWGCPAVPMNERNTVIAKLKSQALIYAGLSDRE